MKNVMTFSDMGSIKIFNDTMSCFFDNNIGDVKNDVVITEKESDYQHDYKSKFAGHFTVKTEAYLSKYDCSEEPVHTFGAGRWFVELLEPAYFHIYKVDEDLNA